MSDIFVQSFTHLKDRPKADRALPMLQRIASLVKPIMRKRNWVLPVLAEFFPESPNLLGMNVNRGQKILLRLRPPYAPDTFLEEEDVVQTMLHELTHNVHGPHDEKFYKFLSGLQDEYDALQRSGYSGEGFFSKGQRLGTNVSHDLPPHLARAKALEAAEKRRNTGRVLGTGGRLGAGRPNTKGLTPRELAAQAAERRARDEKACGSGPLAQQEAAKAAKESVEDKVIDLTLDSDSEPEIIVGKGKSTVAKPSKTASERPRASASTSRTHGGNALPDRPAEHSRGSKDSMSLLSGEKVAVGWACTTCTLANGPQALQCDACLTERPYDKTIGWMCLTCGESGMPHEFWTCRFCGTMKTQS